MDSTLNQFFAQNTTIVVLSIISFFIFLYIFCQRSLFKSEKHVSFQDNLIEYI